MRLAIPCPNKLSVIPAKAGIQSGRAWSFVTLDPRLRGDDDLILGKGRAGADQSPGS